MVEIDLAICAFSVVKFFYLVSFFFHTCYNYWPGKEDAMVIIVVSLPCTAYLCGSFIVF